MEQSESPDFSALMSEIRNQKLTEEAARQLRIAYTTSSVKNHLCNLDIEMICQSVGNVDLRNQIKQLSDFSRSQFYFVDYSVAVIGIPIGVQLTSPRDGMCKIEGAVVDATKEISKQLRVLLGASRVVIDSRIYGGEAISGSSAQDVFEYAIELNAHSSKSKPLGKAVSFDSRSEPGWDLGYLIAVATLPPSSPMALEQSFMIPKLGEVRQLAASAIADSEELIWNEVVEVDAIGIGAYYLDNAVREGNLGLRESKLKSFLRALELGIHGAKFSYAQNYKSRTIHVLVSSAFGSTEYRWATESDENEIFQFTDALLNSADEIDLEIKGLQELNYKDYQDLAKEKGLLWL